MRSADVLAATVEWAARRAEAAGLPEPARRVLEAVVASEWSCQWVATLDRVAAVWDREAAPGATVAGLAPAWLTIWAAGDRAAVATLSGWAAERLGVQLVYPAAETTVAEPAWVIADDEFWEAHGRQPHEPDHYEAEVDYGSLRRSKTAWDRIANTLACGMTPGGAYDVAWIDEPERHKILSAMRAQAREQLRREMRERRANNKGRRTA